MKVVVLTTSYPRHADDVAGHFVRDAVERVRAAGVDVEVVSPASFRHYGIAYGHGVLGNLRRRPWLVLLLPAFLVAFARAARRAASDADLVHAHWLPSALVALATGNIGVRLNPMRTLLISANLLFNLTNAGLGDRVTPAISIDYAF